MTYVESNTIGNKEKRAWIELRLRRLFNLWEPNSGRDDCKLKSSNKKDKWMNKRAITLTHPYWTHNMHEFRYATKKIHYIYIPVFWHTFCFLILLLTDPTTLPPGALFQKQTVDGDVVHTDTYYPMQNVRKTSTTITKHEAPRYEGIGPKDKDGLPLGLRQVC